jgi:hypothetical protein
LLIKINNGVADQKNAFADQKNNSADHFTNSLFLITPKFEAIFWDIYYIFERLQCRLSKNIQTFNKFGL